MTITQEITLDVSVENTYKTFTVQQLDENSRFLNVTVKDYGKKIEIPSSATVILGVRRSDAEARAFEGSANSDGTATVQLPNWMLAIAGMCRCSISVVVGEEKLSTLNFSVLVKEAPYNNNDISQDARYDLLTTLLSDVKATEKNITAGEASRVEAEKQRQAQTAQAIEEANEATTNANNAAQQAASAVLSGGFIPIYDEDNDKNYNYQIVIRNGYPVLTVTEIIE